MISILPRSPEISQPLREPLGEQRPHLRSDWVWYWNTLHTLYTHMKAYRHRPLSESGDAAYGDSLSSLTGVVFLVSSQQDWKGQLVPLRGTH